MFFNGTEMRCKSISKSFQNIVNAFSNIDNAFNETAGHLESFVEPLLSIIKIFTTKCYPTSMNSSTYSVAFNLVRNIKYMEFSCNFAESIKRSLVKLQVSCAWLLFTYLFGLASALMVLNELMAVKRLSASCVPFK